MTMSIPPNSDNQAEDTQSTEIAPTPGSELTKTASSEDEVKESGKTVAASEDEVKESSKTVAASEGMEEKAEEAKGLGDKAIGQS
jgi:hypothetical protein